jgi:hypothetical protein
MSRRWTAGGGGGSFVFQFFATFVFFIGLTV